MTNRQNTFGKALRAYRLGYSHYGRLKAWIRIEDSGTYINVTCVPFGEKVPNGKKVPHVCWWEGEEDLIAMMPALSNVKKINKTISFDIDRESGERITKS